MRSKRTRTAVTTMAFVVIAVATASGVLASSKLPRLCFVTFDPSTREMNRYGAFFERLRDLGYVDGRTITIDYLSAEGRGERFPVLAAECVRREATIIATTTTPAAQAVKHATRAIPIVMLVSGDPVGAGLVQSLGKPGGNVTGQSFMAPGLAAKRLELLKEVAPAISRVLVLTYRQDPIAEPQLVELRKAAQALKLTLLVQEIRTPDDFAGAFAAGVAQRADAVTVTSESISLVNRARVLDLAAKHRLPGAFPWKAYAESGGLIAYAHDAAELYRGAAVYVDRILKGAKPADLPVGLPTRFELVINVKAARALGLTVPPSLLLRADALIE